MQMHTGALNAKHTPPPSDLFAPAIAAHSLPQHASPARINTAAALELWHTCASPLTSHMHTAGSRQQPCHGAGLLLTRQYHRSFKYGNDRT